MTDDLANQLRQRASKQFPATPVSLLKKAAERIRSLTAERNHANDMADVAIEKVRKVQAERDVLADKLAMAVELIFEKGILATYEDHVQWKKTTLAAIKGDAPWTAAPYDDKITALEAERDALVRCLNSLENLTARDAAIVAATLAELKGQDDE